MKIKTIYGEPVLEEHVSDVKTGPNVGKAYGTHRDRNPDRDWSELRISCMSEAKEVELTFELRLILLCDLAYAYGNNTNKFMSKIKEFEL